MEAEVVENHEAAVEEDEEEEIGLVLAGDKDGTDEEAAVVSDETVTSDEEARGCDRPDVSIGATKDNVANGSVDEATEAVDEATEQVDDESLAAAALTH